MHLCHILNIFLKIFRKHSHLFILMILSGFTGLSRFDASSVQKIAHREFLMNYQSNALRLQDLTRISIRRYLGLKNMYTIRHLPLPNKLKDFLLLRDTDLIQLCNMNFVDTVVPADEGFDDPDADKLEFPF